MEKREFETPFGPVWLWGEAGAFEGERPLVVAIAGAFAIEKGPLFRLAAHLPGCEIVTGHLPGNHCPTLIATSVGVYAAAYSHVIDRAFAGRTVVGCGASVGGLVTLGLRAAPLRRLVVMEPPLRMTKLWPMRAFLQSKLRDNPQNVDLRAFITNVFGVSETSIEERDYTGLVERLSLPVRMLIGDEPLYPERPVAKLPSLVDAPERELMAAHPRVSLAVAAGVGHNVPEGASGLMVHALRSAVSEAA